MRTVIQREPLMNLEAHNLTMNPAPVHSARGCWSWHFVCGSRLAFVLDVPARTMEQSRRAAILRAISIAEDENLRN